MVKIKYSVIVPVYNKSEYLEECVYSIINQHYRNIEILLINDGSTDNSLDICERFEEIDKRVVVIDKINTGVSDTRNLGIEKAKGDYIVFVDADDVLNCDFFEVLDKYVGEYDLVIYKSCRDRRLLGKIEKTTQEMSLKDVQEKVIKSVLYNQHLIKLCGANFNRVTDYVVSAKLLKEYNILFAPELKVGEDKIFNFDLFRATNNIFYLNQYLYYIRTNDKSVMGSYNPKAFKNNELLYKAFKQKIELIGGDTGEELEDLMDCVGFQVVWNSITSDYCHKNNPLNLNERKKRYMECKEYLDDDALEYLNDYEKYLFTVFELPFFLISVIMKHRVIRGGGYYLWRFLRRCFNDS